MCVSVSIRAPRSPSIGLLSGWSVPREEHWKHYTYIHTHKHTHTQRETGNHTNAAQQRVEQAGAFFQMCDINLVDPKHEPVAPTHSSPLCETFILTF